MAAQMILRANTTIPELQKSMPVPEDGRTGFPCIKVVILVPTSTPDRRRPIFTQSPRSDHRLFTERR